MKKHTNDFEHDAIPQLVLRLAIPTMLAQLVSVLYSIVDRMYIGIGVGDLALAGVGVCSPIVTPLSSFRPHSSALAARRSWPCGWAKVIRRKPAVS